MRIRNSRLMQQQFGSGFEENCGFGGYRTIGITGKRKGKKKGSHEKKKIAVLDVY